MPAAAIVLADQPLSDGTNAALLPAGDDLSLVEMIVAAVRAAGIRDIEVVLGHDAERVIPLVHGDNVEPIINEAWGSGVASSLRVGASAVPRGAAPIVILPVSTARPADIIRRALDLQSRTSAHLVQATLGGVPSWPCVVTGPYLESIRNLPDAAPRANALGDAAGEMRRLITTSDAVELPLTADDAIDIVRAEDVAKAVALLS